MPTASDSKTPSPRLRPTGARHWILLFAATLAIITYIDRVCISQAAGDIQGDLGLTKVEMGWAFAAASRVIPSQRPSKRGRGNLLSDGASLTFSLPPPQAPNTRTARAQAAMARRRVREVSLRALGIRVEC